MSEPSCPLAIIVPAFKARFLAEALQSIAAQTDRRFRLYVFDDGSPENLEAVFRAAGLPETASFHRFEENVGGRSVVDSWRRCVAMTNEPWIWLFSDDDVMQPGCLAAFYDALEHDGDIYNVYRFNTLVIDQDGRVVRIHPPNPERETAEEFIYHRLTNQRLTLAPEHIFRRSAYETRGGFVDFPFAMGSDDATWINLAGNDTLLRGIAGPRVHWRLSRINLSAFATSYVAKLLGLLTYAEWLYRRFGDDILRTVDGRPAAFRTRELVRQWLLGHIHRAPHIFTLEEVNLLAREITRKLDIPGWQVRLVLFRSNLWFAIDWVKRTIFNRPAKD